MANEMALAYIGKMLGQMGAALGGNQAHLQNYGSQAAASNENLLADLQYEKYKKEQEEAENKGFLGDIIKLGGTAASVAFPGAAPVIAPVTGAVGGAVTGGAKGAVSGGISGGFQGMNAKGGDGATAGSDIVVQGDPIPYDPPQDKRGLFSTIMSNPQVQEQLTGIANKLTAPSKPHLSTAGLYPETATNLRRDVMAQENADRQFQMEQQQSQERTAYYKQNQAMDREKLDFEKAQATAKANAPNSITTNELLRLEDGSVGTGSISPNGQVNIQPVPGVTLPEKTQNKQFVNLGGVNVPVEALFPQIESWKQAHPEMTDYEIVQNMALENADYMSQYKPQLPYMVNQGDQVTAIPRNAQDTPTTIPVPPSPRQAAADARAAEDQELQRKSVEEQSAAREQSAQKSYNDMATDRAKTFTTKLKEQRSVQGTPIPRSAKTALATKINALAKKADGGEYLIEDYDISNISDADGTLSADVTFYAGGEPLPPQRIEVKY